MRRKEKGTVLYMEVEPDLAERPPPVRRERLYRGDPMRCTVKSMKRRKKTAACRRLIPGSGWLNNP